MSFSNSKINDSIKPTGIFRLAAFDDDGNQLWEYEDANLVVTVGRTSLATLLGSAILPNKHVDQISFGDNGADPIISDTAITNPFTKALAGVSYPAAGSVQFDFTLELSENNGVTIREFGLISNDLTLFARKTRAPIEKDNTIRLEGSWTVTF